MLTILLLCMILVGIALFILNKTLQLVLKALNRLEEVDRNLNIIVEHYTLEQDQENARKG